MQDGVIFNANVYDIIVLCCLHYQHSSKCSTILHSESSFHLMTEWKTVVTPLLMHWTLHSLVLYLHFYRSGATRLNELDMRPWTENDMVVVSIWRWFCRTSFKIKSTAGTSLAAVWRRRRWVARIFKNTGLPGNFGPQIRLPDDHFIQFRAIGLRSC